MNNTVCPICYTRELVEFNTRPAARCPNCGSLERGRLAWVVLSRLGGLFRGARFLNIAPEPFMLRHARNIIGDGYVAADYSPENFNNAQVKIQKLDLCASEVPFNKKTFDVVMHNHVLEHVRCDVASVIRRLNSLIKPGGLHVFSIPISPGRESEEDLSFDLSDEERKQRFGQEDHVRVFGRDYEETFRHGGLAEGLIDLSTLVSAQELEIWGVPQHATTKPSGHRVFAWRAPN